MAVTSSETLAPVAGPAPAICAALHPRARIQIDIDRGLIRIIVSRYLYLFIFVYFALGAPLFFCCVRRYRYIFLPVRRPTSLSTWGDVEDGSADSDDH